MDNIVRLSFLLIVFGAIRLMEHYVSKKRIQHLDPASDLIRAAPCRKNQWTKTFRHPVALILVLLLSGHVVTWAMTLRRVGVASVLEHATREIPQADYDQCFLKQTTMIQACLPYDGSSYEEGGRFVYPLEEIIQMTTCSKGGLLSVIDGNTITCSIHESAPNQHIITKEGLNDKRPS